MTSTTKKIFHDKVYLRIVDGCTDTDTEIKVNHEDILSLLEKWESGTEFYLTITNASYDREIVKVTDIDFDTDTFVERGQDSTSAQEWYSGDIMTGRLVAGNLDDFVQKEAYRTSAVNPNGVLTANYRGEKVFQSGQKIWWKHVSGTEWQLIAGAIQVLEWTDAEEEYGFNDITYNEDSNHFVAAVTNNDSDILIFISSNRKDWTEI